MSYFVKNLQKIILLALFILTPNISLAKTHQIKMLNSYNKENMIFNPGFIKVNPGDEISFIPVDFGHNSRSVFVPKGAKNWKGDNDKKITITLNHEGIYVYECSNHSVMSMVGIIQVGDPHNLDEARNFIKNYKKKLVFNKQRLDEYFSKISPDI